MMETHDATPLPATSERVLNLINDIATPEDRSTIGATSETGSEHIQNSVKSSRRSKRVENASTSQTSSEHVQKTSRKTPALPFPKMEVPEFKSGKNKGEVCIIF
jgi:DNA polymerase II large subunit